MVNKSDFNHIIIKVGVINKFCLSQYETWIKQYSCIGDDTEYWKN